MTCALRGLGFRFDRLPRLNQFDFHPRIGNGERIVLVGGIRARIPMLSAVLIYSIDDAVRVDGFNPVYHRLFRLQRLSKFVANLDIRERRTEKGFEPLRELLSKRPWRLVLLLSRNSHWFLLSPPHFC